MEKRPEVSKCSRIRSQMTRREVTGEPRTETGGDLVETGPSPTKIEEVGGSD